MLTTLATLLGTITFQSAPGPWGSHLTAGDLDGDGRTDVALTIASNAASDQFLIRVYPNTGAPPYYGPSVDVALPRPAGDLTLVDVNGDGALDLLASLGHSLGVSLNEGRSRFGALFEIPFGSGLAGLASADLDGDGVPEIVAADRGDQATRVWTLPARRSYTQELTDMPAPAVTLAPGRDERISVHQAMQYVETLAVRVRIEGQGLQGLTLSIRAPDGQIVELERGAGRDASPVWAATYPTRAPTGDLSTLAGRWQPEGDWTLVIDNDGAVGDVRDFAVVTHGAFMR